VLGKAQNKMNQVQNDLETLVGVRTRGIQRALKDVTSTSQENEITGGQSLFDPIDE
jgi:DNA anti-recombination protein RmuC